VNVYVQKFNHDICFYDNNEKSNINDIVKYNKITEPNGLIKTITIYHNSIILTTIVLLYVYYTIIALIK